mgnify:CR=1 FL=1
MDRDELLDRAKGSLYGLAIGDALGAPVEGWSVARIRETYGWISGYVCEDVAGTDDTEFAVLTARCICKAGGVPAPDFLATMWLEHCADWPLKRDLMSSGGMSEKRTVANLLRGLQPPFSGRYHMANSSCGAAMRVAPCGIAAPGNLDLARRLARADASVSHWDEGVIQAEAIASAVCMAMAGHDLPTILNAALAAIPEESWTRYVLEQCFATVSRYDNPRDALPELWAVSDTGVPNSHGPGACALALTALRYGGGDFRETVLLAVNAGRDCDSSAAQAGAIVGAAVGYRGLPAEWATRIGPLPGDTLSPMAGVVLANVAADLVDAACWLAQVES